MTRILRFSSFPLLNFVNEIDVLEEPCLCQNDSGSTLSVVSSSESRHCETIVIKPKLNWLILDDRLRIWVILSTGGFAGDPHESEHSIPRVSLGQSWLVILVALLWLVNANECLFGWSHTCLWGDHMINLKLDTQHMPADKLNSRFTGTESGWWIPWLSSQQSEWKSANNQKSTIRVNRMSWLSILNPKFLSLWAPHQTVLRTDYCMARQEQRAHSRLPSHVHDLAVLPGLSHPDPRHSPPG